MSSDQDFAVARLNALVGDFTPAALTPTAVGDLLVLARDGRVRPGHASLLTAACGLFSEAAAADAELSAELGRAGLVKGLADLLRPLADRAAGDESSASDDAAPVALVRLLAVLLRAAPNAALVHLRGDAALLAQLGRTARGRPLRHAALAAGQAMGVAGGAAEAAAAVELLVEALQQCAAPVRTRRPADGACWQAVATLCALWHTLEGRPMAATLGGAAPPHRQ